ncbi:hypothetical protein IHE45_19G189100 [Dioscorea alata]|uniref:Uncharacterized protein n=1 Tax=Dioscorea alata TaxID=55571 RepID=A0ACB7U494_DIOAL|nr:hypothetical protein IHE45_19G189100 [Dioscorea alata]
MGITTATRILVSVLGLVLVLLSGTICSASRTLESTPKATQKHTNVTSHNLDTANGAGHEGNDTSSVHGLKVGGEKEEYDDHDGKRKHCHYHGYDEDCDDGHGKGDDYGKGRDKGYDSGYGRDGGYDDGYGKGKDKGCDDGYGGGGGFGYGDGYGKGKDRGRDSGYGSGWNGYGYGYGYGGGGGGYEGGYGRRVSAGHATTAP